jgi:hypothetical protein
MVTLTLLAGERQPGESEKAVIACNDWLRLGPGRTLGLLLAKYTKTHRSTPPTASLDTLKAWSADCAWAERAIQFDAQLEEAKNAERQRVMSSGFAQDYARVRELDKLITFLARQVYAKDGGGPNGESPFFNVWLRDAKQIGGGENSERVDIVRFDGALLDQLRGALDDIAKETGGRKQVTDLNVNGGLKITGDDIHKAQADVSAWEADRGGGDTDAA